MIQFTVFGTPQQRGSKNAQLIPKRGGGWVEKNGRPIVGVRDDNKKSKDWMRMVTDKAAEVFHGELLRSPIELSVTFYFSRPRSHLGTGRNGGNLKQSAPHFHAQTPDLAKLMRCIEDAMTGVIWADDKQVCRYGDCRREWTMEQERAEVTITPLTETAGITL